MAMTASAAITLNAREALVDGDRTLQDKTSISDTFTFLDAAGALGVTKKFSDNRTLDTTNETLDLSGALASGLGTVTVFAKVLLFAVRWNGAGTMAVDTSLSNGATGLFSGTVTLGAGGWLIIVDPTSAARAIGAGTTDLVKFTTTGAGDYDIEVWGQ
jgi:hypothetical protein